MKLTQEEWQEIRRYEDAADASRKYRMSNNTKLAFQLGGLILLIIFALFGALVLVSR